MLIRNAPIHKSLVIEIRFNIRALIIITGISSRPANNKPVIKTMGIFCIIRRIKTELTISILVVYILRYIECK